MFARKVAARLKPNSLTEFTNLMEHEILPWLRKQEGFLDLITLAAPDGLESLPSASGITKGMPRPSIQAVIQKR
jgi:hypothetical protein